MIRTKNGALDCLNRQVKFAASATVWGRLWVKCTNYCTEIVIAIRTVEWLSNAAAYSQADGAEFESPDMVASSVYEQKCRAESQFICTQYSEHKCGCVCNIWLRSLFCRALSRLVSEYVSGPNPINSNSRKLMLWMRINSRRELDTNDF